MLQLILAGIGFSFWALYTIITYYSTSYSNINHIEGAATGYTSYLISLLVIYSGYKIYSIFYDQKRTVKYHLGHIIGFSVLHLLIICISYTGIIQGQVSSLFNGVTPSSMVLFFHSVSLLLYPVLLIIITRSLGSTLLSRIIPNWQHEYLRLRFPVETAFGFFIFSCALLGLGALGQYNLIGLLSVLSLISIISIPGFITTYREALGQSVSFENHNPSGGLLSFVAPRLISAEIAFLIVSFLISVSLINAMRPMPIGWDDLGVYMNLPKIMALSSELIKGNGMYAWQLITGTGYLFSYIAAQAFYINQLGGILAVITITCGLSLLFEEKNKKYLLSLPIIFATIFYAMPMNIFQQAKDMKLDPALLFVSISAFMLLYSAWKNNESSKKNYILIAIAGLIVGFAFSIKYTTLMLILGGIGLLSYNKLGLFGFLGYFFLFLGVFTKLGLWKLMNVLIPTDNPNAISLTLIGFFILSIVCFVISYFQYKKDALVEWTLSVLVFIVTIAVGVSPWLVKNILEIKPWDPSYNSNGGMITSLLNGSGGTLVADYSKIYTKEEYEHRQKAEKDVGITSDGKSQNEDLGRYFGYEEGINNYLKLPANITFQKNQPGEFTDITFIFLAFLPSILLFVRGRRGLYPGFIAVLITGMFLYYFKNGTSEVITSFFSTITLPFGYLVLLGGNIVFLLIAHFTIEDTERNTKIREILMTLGIYGFLFAISAFGIVWYGILVYFLFLALIGLAALSFVAYDESDEKNDDLMSVKITLVAILSIFILTYFIRSSLPHGWNNLRDASYNEFKYRVLNQEESIFAYRQDYITPIATMNINNVDALIEKIKKEANVKELQTLFVSDKLKGIGIRDFSYVLFSLSNTKNIKVADEASRLGNILYKAILYPDDSLRNNGGIYRIGTFMTYLIDRNRQRYFDDSLVFMFEKNFYDPNAELTIDRMKKIGLKYLLVDLNAATIDKDPRHALTKRFEMLLNTMKARNLRLVDTDSTCLRFAIDMYKNGKLQNPDDYISIAGTNYEGYKMENGQEVTITRGQKQGQCYNAILKELFAENGVDKYPYLAQLKEAIDAEKAYGTDATSQKKLQQIFAQFFGQSWFALFEIHDAPQIAPVTAVIPEQSATGNTITNIRTLTAPLGSGSLGK